MSEEFIWGIKNGDIEAVQKYVDENGKNDVVNMEIKGRRPMHYAADYGQAEIIEYLLSKKADINKPDQHGITPLLNAIFEGHENCVKLLLSKGADKNGKTPSGDTYYSAAETDSMKLLIK